MQLKKIRATMTPCSDSALQIQDVTLLSSEEYEAAKKDIPPLDDWWWLRSPGLNSIYAAGVRSGGSVYADGYGVSIAGGVVRPALRISNLKSLDLQIGDKISDLAGHTWTVIANDLILCDDGIGQHCFREDRKAEEANVYEKSDIKKYLEVWASEHQLLSSKQLGRIIADLDTTICDTNTEFLYPKSESERVNREMEIIPAICLAADIEWLSMEATDHDAELLKIEESIRKTGLEAAIKKAIGWDRIVQGVHVRTDFGAALKNVRRGSDLSSVVNYRFSQCDLVALLELHKRNKFRKKIEDLLDYCNFHSVSGMLATREYDRLKEMWKQEEHQNAKEYFLDVLNENVSAFGPQVLTLINSETSEKETLELDWPSSPELQEQAVDVLLNSIAKKGPEAIRDTMLSSIASLAE